MPFQRLQVGIFLASGLLLMLLGSVIFREGTGRRLNRVTATMLFFGGLGALMSALGSTLTSPATASVLEAAGEAPVGIPNIREFAVLWEFFFPTLVLFSLIFPREADSLKRHPRLSWLIYLPYFLHLVVVVLSLDSTVLDISDMRAPGGLLGPFLAVFKMALFFITGLLKILISAHIKLWAGVNVLFVSMAIYFLWRTGKTLTNRRLSMQLTILQVGIGIGVGLYIVAEVVPILLPFLQLPQGLTALMLSTGILTGCGAIAWVIVRHQFLDVQVLAKRSMIYSAATGVVVGIFFLLYTLFTDLYQSLMGGMETNSAFVQIVFIVIAVLAFQPLRGWIEMLVDRFFIRDTTDYRNILRESANNIIGILDMDSLMRATYQTLEKAFLVEEAAIILLDRKTGAFRFVRRGPPPLKQREWELKPPKALESDDGLIDQTPEEGLLDARRRAAAGPGRAIFRLGDPVAEALARASGPVKFDRLTAEIPEEELGNRPPLEGLNPQIVIPLKQRHDLVGVITLGAKLADTGFKSEELTLLSVLGSQVAIAIENAGMHQERIEQERIREEMAVAREIQQALLPIRFPKGPGFEVSAINLPSQEIGGDYFDFIRSPISEEEPIEKLLLVVGDVSGKGTPAALLMASLQASLRAVYETQSGLSATAERVNSMIFRTTAAEKFVTLFLAEYDVTTRTLTYVNAGHNFPILIRGSGERVLLDEGGLLVGVVEQAVYEEGQIGIEPGDVLTVYTDGVTEAMNIREEEFGEERLMDVLNSRSYLAAREIRDEIYREVLTHAGDRAQSDDLTLIVLKCL